MNAPDPPLDRELFEALAPERAEVGSFARGVEQRIQAQQARAAKPAQEGRAAAGMLPPFMVPGIGGAGSKTLLSTLTLPVTLVGAFAYLLIAGFGASRRLDDGRDGRNHPAQDLLRWWEAHRLALVPVVCLLVYLGWNGNLDVLIALLLLSMGSVVWSLKSLSARGLASRRIVGNQAGAFLVSSAMWLWLLGQRSVDLRATPLQVFLAYLAMLLFGYVCLLLGGTDSTSNRRRHSGPRWLGVPPNRVLVGLLVAGLLAFLFLNLAVVRSGSSTTELASWAANRTPEDWFERREHAELIRVVRKADPGLAALSLAETRLASDPIEGLSELALGDLAELGLLSNADFESILSIHATPRRKLLEDSGALKDPARSRALRWALVDLDRLTPAEREHLSQRLLASWSADNEFAQLETLLEIALGLEHLERQDLVDGLAGEVQRALLDAWIPNVPGQPIQNGGFAKYYRRNADHPSLDATGYALRLMERFGVPADIDLPLLHGYLIKSAERYGYVTQLDKFDTEVATLLLRFETVFGERLPYSGRAPVWTWRFLGGVLALCALCLIATLQAPKPGSASAMIDTLGD